MTSESAASEYSLMPQARPSTVATMATPVCPASLKMVRKRTSPPIPKRTSAISAPMRKCSLACTSSAAMQPMSAQMMVARRFSAYATGSKRTARRGDAVSASATPMEQRSPSTRSVTYGAWRKRFSELVMIRQSSGFGSFLLPCGCSGSPPPISFSSSFSFLPSPIAAAYVSFRGPMSRPRSFAPSTSADSAERDRAEPDGCELHAPTTSNTRATAVPGTIPRANDDCHD